MKKLLLPFVALTIWTASCSKKDSYRGSGQVIGYDGTYCACCGGYMIRLADDDSKPYYIARTLPANLGLNPMSTYPVNVELDYEKNVESCDEIIRVTRIVRK